VVEAHHEVAETCQIPVKQSSVPAPTVLNRLRRGLTVDVNQNRIFPGRIEASRLDHIAVNANALSSFYLEILHTRIQNVLHFGLCLFARRKGTDNVMVRERNHFADSRIVKTRERMKGILAVRGNRIVVASNERSQRDTYRIR